MRNHKSLLLLLTVLLITVLTGCTVVKIGEEDKLTGEVEFSAGDNVSEIWDIAALPELEEKAVDLNTLIAEANGDLNSVADKYGTYSMGTSGELTYTVKGTGIVEEVDTEKRAGFIEFTLDGYSGPVVTRLQIGPVFTGSAVRDALDIIQFEDYKNQVDYAAVSQSIHDLILETVIEPVDLNSLQGAQIEFTGCFTVKDEELLIITPVSLTVK